jgi:Bacterial aa3 type cytochrome c oxidase subunit IV
MAADQLTAGDGLGGHTAKDYPAHVASYRLFTQLIKWGAIGVISALLLLAFLTL